VATDHGVGSSNLSWGTTFYCGPVAHQEEQRSSNPQAECSNHSRPTKFMCPDGVTAAAADSRSVACKGVKVRILLGAPTSLCAAGETADA
jgi:hypothetical protein